MNDEELRRLVVEQLEVARQGFGPAGGEPAGDSLDLTSLELVRVLVNLEEQLDTEIDEVSFMNARLETVDDIVALLRESLALSPTGAAE
jgi:acyl carrier protein